MSVGWKNQLEKMYVRLQSLKKHRKNQDHFYHGVVFTPEVVESVSTIVFPRISVFGERVAETYVINCPGGGCHVHYILEKPFVEKDFLAAFREEFRGFHRILSGLPKSIYGGEKSLIPQLSPVRSCKGNLTDDFLGWLYVYQWLGSQVHTEIRNGVEIDCEPKFQTDFEFFNCNPLDIGDAESELNEESWQRGEDVPSNLQEFELSSEVLDMPKPWAESNCRPWDEADALPEFDPIYATNLVEAKNRRSMSEWFKIHDKERIKLPRFIAASISKPLLSGAISGLRIMIDNAERGGKRRIKRKGNPKGQLNDDAQVLLALLTKHHKVRDPNQNTESIGSNQSIADEINKEWGGKWDVKRVWNATRVSRAFTSLFVDVRLCKGGQAKSQYERLCVRILICEALQNIEIGTIAPKLKEMCQKHGVDWLVDGRET